MDLLLERDYELMAEAQKAIRLNYDQEHYNHNALSAGSPKEFEMDKSDAGSDMPSCHPSRPVLK